MQLQITKYIITEFTTILDAMKVIDRGEMAIAFVCAGRKLLATVTDGDIRRHIIANGNLQDSISHIANYHPCYVYETQEYNPAQFLREHCISALPVLNLDNEIVDIVFSVDKDNKEYKQIDVPVVIMAGGKGTRLKPYTQILPKPLIPIGEKTITEHIMDRFLKYGCQQFDMIVNYRKNFIISYFKDSEADYNLSFLEEDDFYGTAGGLKLVEEKYQDDFFVTNCDVLINTDYSAVLKQHKEQENIITIVCAMKKVIVPYGTVELSDEGKVCKLTEKPEFNFMTSTGFYVISPEFIKMIPENTFIHITDVIQQCIEERKKVGIFPIDDDAWMDMGQLDELEKMKIKIESNTE